MHRVSKAWTAGSAGSDALRNSRRPWRPYSRANDRRLRCEPRPQLAERNSRSILGPGASGACVARSRGGSSPLCRTGGHEGDRSDPEGQVGCARSWSAPAPRRQQRRGADEGECGRPRRNSSGASAHSLSSTVTGGLGCRQARRGGRHGDHGHQAFEQSPGASCSQLRGQANPPQWRARRASAVPGRQWAGDRTLGRPCATPPYNGRRIGTSDRAKPGPYRTQCPIRLQRISVTARK